MFEELAEWLAVVLGAQWELVDGGLPDSSAFDGGHYCVIRGMGGAAPDVDDRRPRYRVLLLGPKNNRAAKADTRTAVKALMDACLGDTTPCGAASVKALGEPIGPSYTVDDRAWMSVDLQLTF